MPYFPKEVEVPPYKCQGCGGGWFKPGWQSCLVLHAPGTCCHTYEVPSEAPRLSAKRDRD